MPPRELLRDQPRAIVPDAAVDLALPPAATRRYVQQGRTPQPLTRHLVDFKSIMAGGDIYRCARARDEQSGAVAERAHRVHPDYLRAARSLDTQFYAAPATPVMDRLLSHGQVRAMVFGAHGEGSPDVHHSIEASARQRARQTWRGFGARTEEEAYGYWVQQFRRLMGVTIVREFARLRIRRVPFLGVPREFVRDRARGRRVVQEVPAHGRHAGDFFGHQGRMFHR